MLECNDCYFSNIEEYATCSKCENRNLWVSEGTYKLIKELKKEVKMLIKQGNIQHEQIQGLLRLTEELWDKSGGVMK